MKISFLGEGAFTPYKNIPTRSPEDKTTLARSATAKIAQDIYIKKQLQPIVSEICNNYLKEFFEKNSTRIAYDVHPFYIFSFDDYDNTPKNLDIKIEVANGVLTAIIPVKPIYGDGRTNAILKQYDDLVEMIRRPFRKVLTEKLMDVFNNNELGNPMNIKECVVKVEYDSTYTSDKDCDIDILRFNRSSLDDVLNFFEILYLRSPLKVACLDLYCTFSRSKDLSELKELSNYLQVKDTVFYALTRNNQLETLQGAREALLPHNPDIKISLAVENVIAYNVHTVKESLINEIFGMSISDLVEFINKRDDDKYKPYYLRNKLGRITIPLGMKPSDIDTADFDVNLVKY